MAGAGPTPGLPGAGGPVVQGPGAGIPGKIGEERLKEMEAEMALFEQEVLGAPVTGIPTAVPTVPTVESMQVPAAPVIRPIIATNTYQQVQQTLEARAAAAATVVSPMVGGPPFVGPVGFGPGDRSHLDSPEAREAMFLLPPLRIPELLSLRPRPRPPRPEPPPGLMALEVPEPLGEDKKKGKPEKLKRCIRTAAGSSWEDPSLLEWDADDFRIFCGDLGNEVNDDILARAFSRFPSFLKAKVIRDKRTGKTKGYGFVSFKDPSDYVRAMREMNGKYVGSRPIKLRKSMWKDRNLDVVRKKQKEKKKLGLR
ncbi:RNA binding motif protein 42 [Rhinolophus ferrumequinum]|uniref:RNA-binding protein 42 n=1 Tax=Rhinolophus ferrumequinum TaxID=59479 RepID=A0A7J7SKL8_RHIFE|nr:RNA binding motif protein 42 [Rhinolophus ferrumequinum]